jgi:hypothetical protein
MRFGLASWLAKHLHKLKHWRGVSGIFASISARVLHLQIALTVKTAKAGIEIPALPH